MAGLDFALAGTLTTQSMCSAIDLSRNTIDGNQVLWLNALNSSQSISNIQIGAAEICDADNINLDTISFIGSQFNTDRNTMEFIQANNITVQNVQAQNVYSMFRILSANNSRFANSISTGGVIGAINANGGSSNFNTIDTIDISNYHQYAGISIGGIGNNITNIYVHDANSTGSAIGFGAATTTINNSYTQIHISNTSKGVYMLS